MLRGWLDGDGVPAGLAIDTELRWTLLHALVAAGAAGPTEIEAELDRDRTASGERAAAQAPRPGPDPRVQGRDLAPPHR